MSEGNGKAESVEIVKYVVLPTYKPVRYNGS